MYESKGYSNGTLQTALGYTDKLQLIGHEEGRIRPLFDNAATPNSLTGFAYDYMLKDHLGNVRMVLTEEQKTDAYPVASMETGSCMTENIYYSNINTTRELKPSGYPADYYTDPNDYAAKVRGDGNKIGPAMLLKVMAGDKFNIRVSSWYKTDGASPGTPVSPLNDLLSILTNSIGGITSTHGGVTTAELQNSGVLPPGVTSFLNSQSYNGSKPKAFISWLFLDEQFKYYAGSFDQVGNNEEFKTHTFNEVLINKSGYLYIYVSNETPNISVFFDNLQVTHIRGAILEETHYYPAGGKLAGICSQAANSLDNKYEYNGQEIQEDFDIDWYQYKWRNYDPQIGRFFCVDPLAPKYEYLTPYQFASNNPISMRELEGLEGIKFQEVDENGNLKRHVVQQTVYVVVVDKWDKKGTGRKEPKDRVESSYTSADVAKVKEALNSEFNGSEGTGATNSAGETVFFDFNVQELRIGSQDATTETQLINRGANELSTQSGEVNFVDATTGETVYKKSPANILLGGGSAGAYAEGANNGVRTRLSDGKQLDYGVHLHEMLHQLIKRPGEGEHALGGGLATPAESLSTRNVNAVLQDALKSVTPIRVKKK